MLTALQQQGLGLIEAALVERLGDVGEEAGGLYYYYRSKLAGNALLSDCDLRAIAVLREQRSRGGRVWDIGAGIGQVSAMLALDGWTVIAVDRDRRRFAALERVAAVVTQLDAASGGRLTPKFGNFPDVILGEPVEHDVALTLGCTFRAEERVYEDFRAGLRRFRGSLIDFPRLFIQTDNRMEWLRRAESYCAGLPGSVRTSFPCTVPDVEGTQTAGELSWMECKS
jgi:SAM-dependent methyltransferase